jgi:hypothetical protein
MHKFEAIGRYALVASVKLSSGRWMVKYAGNEVKLSQGGFVLVIK